MCQNILVTGGSRTGTTWVGKILALPEGIKYVYEPFNTGIADSHLQLPFQFTYICEDNQISYYESLTSFLVSQIYESGQQCTVKPPSRLLIKDPISIFSARWLANQFNLKVVMTIRHPAAVVSSRQKLGWRFDFNNFLNQPLLMRDYLFPFEDEMRDLILRDRGIIEESILLWRSIYHVVNLYRCQNSDWLFVRHEDLCREPISGFQRIFRYLDLDMPENICDQIITSTSSRNLVEAESPIQHFLNRDSQQLVHVWKSRLEASQIKRVYEATKDIASNFYSDDEW
jgi:hypothetical protein